MVVVTAREPSERATTQSSPGPKENARTSLLAFSGGRRGFSIDTNRGKWTIHYEYTQHVSSTAVKTIQKQKGQASNETHADGELRDSHKKKVRRDPNMN
jgi:hypothetical protein